MMIVYAAVLSVDVEVVPSSLVTVEEDVIGMPLNADRLTTTNDVFSYHPIGPFGSMRSTVADKACTRTFPTTAVDDGSIVVVARAAKLSKSSILFHPSWPVFHQPDKFIHFLQPIIFPPP